MKLTAAPTDSQEGHTPDCTHYSISVESEHDDLDAQEATEMCYRLLVGMGFTPDLVHKHFVEFTR